MLIVSSKCPSDEVFAQQLMLKGCEPLFRQHYHLKSPVKTRRRGRTTARTTSTPEKVQWLHGNDELDYDINEVLELKRGSIRIGLDIGGKPRSFTAWMQERSVTIVTSTINFDEASNNFIASRGSVPLHMSIHMSIVHWPSFYDGTLIIAHSMHVSNWILDAILEFTLFDIYRVVRPGGLFWIDHFLCVGA
ncbi:hypothetical protein Cni_G05841 [Canna indica]|uniref:Methyltransferase type 11 domain-containing protein n=1 Tax=Canna indica TaxID=4628 RepID=A0AAQ3Q457_9LILI|nr:hypothetical protein Cni_G05841 [Canna indica]